MNDFRRKMKQDGRSILTRDEIFSTMELAYQDVKPLIWCFHVFPSTYAIVQNPEINNIGATIYLSESIKIGKYFNAIYFSVHKEKSEVPIAVCVSETHPNVSHFADQIRQQFPQKFSYIVPCKYWHLFSNAKIIHSSIINHFTQEIKSNCPKHEQKNLQDNLEEMHNCEMWKEVKPSHKILEEAYSRYQHSVKYPDVVKFPLWKVDGSVPFDNLLLSIYALFKNEKIELSKPPPPSPPDDDLYSVINEIAWLDLSIIEDSIVALINSSNKSDRFHLVSLFRNDFSSLVETISTIPSGKILLRVLHTNNGTHWVLGIVHAGKKRIIILDSNRDTIINRLECFKLMYTIGYIYSMTTLSSKGEHVEEWDFLYSSDCPQQTNGADCGLFVVYYVKSILSKSKLEEPLSSRIGRDFIANIIQSIPVRPLFQNQLQPNERLVELYAESEQLIETQSTNINIISESTETKLLQF